MTFDSMPSEALSDELVAKAKSKQNTEGEASFQVVPSSSRGRRRLARILEAATELFLKDGYFGTSIESVLDASGGSKATLYSYFSTKDDLFRAVIEEAIRDQRHPQIDYHEEPRAALVDFAVQAFDIIASPRHSALLRLTLSERDRFADLAERWYEAGPLRMRQALIGLFKDLEGRGRLLPGTAAAAASDYLGLTVRQWWLESLLFDANHLPSREAVRAAAERAADRVLTSPVRSHEPAR